MKQETTNLQEDILNWGGLEISWDKLDSPKSSDNAILLIHGFGANKEHWRHNKIIISQKKTCYAIDLIGFGKSSQPNAKLSGEDSNPGDFVYNFDAWANQIVYFCREVIKKPVILIGNSIGGVIALRASQILEDQCLSIILIDCAQRTMDDKRIKEQNIILQWLRPSIKKLIRNRILSRSLFRNAANTRVIKTVLKQAYPSNNNVDGSNCFTFKTFSKGRSLGIF